MRIIVDGDGCAGRSIIEEIAKKHQVPLKIFCDYNHVITSDYGDVIIMDSGYQAVDMRIATETNTGDIVVTQDFGVAAMVIGKRAYAISPKGYIFSDKNIDKLLFERHLSAKARRSGQKTSNPKKRKEEDNINLRENLERLILKAKDKEKVD